jgi:hypothetical protein
MDSRFPINLHFMGSISQATPLISGYIDILANFVNDFIINLKYQAMRVLGQNFIFGVRISMYHQLIMYLKNAFFSLLRISIQKVFRFGPNLVPEGFPL